MDPVQPPLGGGGKCLRPITVAAVLPGNATAKLRISPIVKMVKHRLADELSLQPDGKIHRRAVAVVPLCHLVKAPFLHRAAKTRHIVIAPPPVSLSIQHQRIVGGNVLLRQLGEGQPLRGQHRQGLYMAQQLILGGKVILGSQMVRPVLQLRGPQPPVGGVVFPVEPDGVPGKVPGKGLHHGGIDPRIGIQRLFDVDNQGVAAPLRQRQREKLFSAHHSPAEEPRLIQPTHRPLCQF
ncbi:hypothetical protein SDC9_131541 [bioreactor metagenome]|uniref:Uncharacterized protein n=1 Tax=bioreactor metagenome TaxID=1076179 RepID=A0A645D5I2_9ZZZZ